MRRGMLVTFLVALVLLTACGGLAPKPEAQTRHFPRLPERTGEQAVYDLLDALLASPVTIEAPPGYGAPLQKDAAAWHPRTFIQGSQALGGMVFILTGPNALDQISFAVAATADAAAQSFLLGRGAFGPVTESFTPAEFNVPAICDVMTATQAGSGGHTGCRALVDNVIVITVTRGRDDPQRGNDADAIALLRLAMTHLQAVQAEQARAAATAPTSRVVRVGLLASHWGREPRGLFLKRMGELGWVRGRNLVMEYRFYETQPERLPELAADLVRTGVDVIVVDGIPATRAARDATATIPVVFQLWEDPVAADLVASYARPGGNLTGVIIPVDPSLAAKRLDLLSEAVPAIRRVGVLVDAPSGPAWRELEQVARSRDLVLLPLVVRDLGEVPVILADGAAAGAQALLMTDMDPYPGGGHTSYFIEVNRFAQQRRLPLVVNGWTPGQVLSYSARVPALSTIAAVQVDRLLRGAKPAQLPVEQVREFDLSVNLRVARTLGLTIAPSVLARATDITDPDAVLPRRVR